MHVLVIREFVNNTDTDLRIVMVASIEGSLSMISPVMTLEGAASKVNGNPHAVYGDACAKFTGKNKFNLHITVAECTNGNLDGW